MKKRILQLCTAIAITVAASITVITQGSRLDAAPNIFSMNCVDIKGWALIRCENDEAICYYSAHIGRVGGVSCKFKM